MQNFSPDKYKGKRLRLTGYVKTKDVEDGWAGLGLRVDGDKEALPDGKQSRKMLAFDNMQNRPLKGTMDCTKCEIVIDVPDSATNIAYSVLLRRADKSGSTG